MKRARKEHRLGFVDYCRVDDDGRVHCDEDSKTVKKFTGKDRWLPLDKAAAFKAAVKGKPGPRSRKIGGKWGGKQGAPFFSSTSKVHAPTWGVPPGATCPAVRNPVLSWLQDAVKDPKLRKPERVINRLLQEIPRKCLACYATSGNYVYAETQQAMKNRAVWFNQTSDAEVVDTLVNAIKHAGNEKCTKVSGCKFTPGVQTEYFRAFDAGDFQGARDVRIWKAVAKRLPGTKFWFPTTAWGGVCHASPKEQKDMQKELRALNALPNAVVRPSSRGIDIPAAQVKGLGPGSAVIEKGTAKAGAEVYRRAVVERAGGRETSSERLISLCEKDASGKETSCRTHYVCPGNCALCRKCWDKKMPVVYKRHGLLPKAENVLKLVRKTTGMETHAKSSKSGTFQKVDEALQNEFGKLFAKMFDGPAEQALKWKKVVKESTER